MALRFERYNADQVEVTADGNRASGKTPHEGTTVYSNVIGVAPLSLNIRVHSLESVIVFGVLFGETHYNAGLLNNNRG